MPTAAVAIREPVPKSGIDSAQVIRLAQRVTRIVSHDGDPFTLAKRVCVSIAHSPLFSGAWVGLHDAETGRIIVRQSGFGRSFHSAFASKGCGGCVASLIEFMGRRSTIERVHQEHPCVSCGLGRMNPSGRSLIVRLEHRSKVMGILALSTSASVPFTEEQTTILHGLGAELGLAFYGLYEKAKAEARRRESEELYRTVFENTGTILWVVEPDGTISLANRVSEVMTGYTREETEYQKRWDDFFVKQDLVKMRRYRRARLHSGRGRAAKQFQARLLTRSGKTRTVLVSPGVVPGTARMIPSMIDITAQKKAERSVLRLNEYLQGIVDNANVLVVLLDGQGKVRVWNRAAELITGYTAAEVVGRGKFWVRLFPYSITDRAAAGLVARISAGAAIEDVDASILTRDGRSRIISWYIKGLIDRKGKLLGVVVLGRDVTSQRETEDKKREAECRARHAERLAAIGEMAAGVAHEINNPLTAMVGLAQLLAREQLTPAAEEYVRSIIEGGGRIARIVDSLLIFAGRHDSTCEPVSLNGCVRSALASRETALREADIRLYEDLDASEPVVRGDAACLERVFGNLLSNAIDELRALDSERRLLLRSRARDGLVEIEVQDNGRGIPHSSLRRVFEPFYTSKRPGKGTGLGLSICHGLVTEHGGRIYARNNAGAGATFVVELPLLT